MQLKAKKGTIPQIPKILGTQEGQEEGRPRTRTSVGEKQDSEGETVERTLS